MIELYVRVSFLVYNKVFILFFTLNEQVTIKFASTERIDIFYRFLNLKKNISNNLIKLQMS